MEDSVGFLMILDDLGGFWRVLDDFGGFLRSGLSSPNGSQEASGGSFSAFLGSARQMALKRPLEAHFRGFGRIFEDFGGRQRET